MTIVLEVDKLEEEAKSLALKILLCNKVDIADIVRFKELMSMLKP